MHDTYPQWFNLNRAKEPAVETLNEVETAMPVRIGERQVMEILGVMWNVVGGPPASVGDLVHLIEAQLTKRSIGTVTGFDLVPRNNIIDWVGWYTVFSLTTSGQAAVQREMTVWHDFAAGGRGPLLASQSIFLQVHTVEDLSPGSEVAAASVRILYKLVTVSAEELIGLVQE